MTRKAYPSDLNDAEWGDIKDLLPPASKIGSPRTIDFREIINAIFYLVNNGIKWRAIPHDFPPWSTVYTYFRRWTRNGLWAEINTILFAKVRLQSGRQTSVKFDHY
jgi:putative transposase